MFSRISSGTKLAMALMLAAGIGLQAEEILPAVDRAEVGKYRAGLQKQVQEAEALIEEGQKCFFAEDYEKAVAAYLEAQRIYVDLIRLNGATPQVPVAATDTPAAERMKNRERDIAKQISESYRSWAQQTALRAHEKSIAGDFDGAIQLCREAIKMYPECREEVESRIAIYEKMKVAADVRTRNSAETVIPNLEDTSYRVTVLLKQAKILFYEGHFTEARQKYQEVLLLNNLQSEAIQGLQACNIQLQKYGEMRAVTSRKRMMAEAVWKGLLPIQPMESSASTASTKDFKRPSISSAIGEMRQKLQGIIIPRIDFTDTPLDEALEKLRSRSKQIDPEGKGVNIVLIYREGEIESSAGLGGNLGDFSSNAGFGTPGLASPDGMASGANSNGGIDVNGGFGGQAAAGNDGFAEEAPVQTVNYPNVNLPLNNKSLLEIIDLIAVQCNLKVKIDGNAVILASRGVALDDMYTDIFPFDQDMRTQLGNSDDPAQLQRSLELAGVEFPDGARVVANLELGSLFVTNTPENLSKVDAFLTQLMKKPVTLVQLQVKFVEIEQNDLKELGFIQTLSRSVPEGESVNGKLEFGQNDNVLRSLSNNTMFTYSRTSDGYDYNLTVNAANQLDSKDMLASPTVLTLPGEEVYIEMEEYRYFAWDYDDMELESATNGNVTTYTLKPQFPTFEVQPLGVSMSITPEVDEANREITMTVSPLLRELVGWSTYNYYVDEDGVPIEETITRPIIAKRTTGTTVTVADNATVVLGGIVKDYSQSIDDKVPFLGDIPVIGRFFRSSGTKVTKTNLLIFITARILEADGTPRFPETGASQMTGTERGVPETGIPGHMR